MNGEQLLHRVSAATNKMEIADAARKGNPGNLTLALDYQKACNEREAAIKAARSSIKLAWVNPDVPSKR